MADAELAAKLARRQRLSESSSIEEQTSHLSLDDVNRLRKNSDIINGNSCPDSSAVSSLADGELKCRLARRQDINEGKTVEANPVKVIKSVYSEFVEFSRKQIKEYEATFRKYDTNKDGFICLDELKFMMEKLGAPQTHLALKNMIKEVDEDKDGKINLREFFLIFRKAAAGELCQDSGLSALAQLSEIDVLETGVGGAKDFFEAKIENLTRSNKFEAEILAEREEKKRSDEEKRKKREEFRSKQAVFSTS